MTTLRTILLASTILTLATPGFAEDAHHPEATGGQAGAEAVEPAAPARMRSPRCQAYDVP